MEYTLQHPTAPERHECQAYAEADGAVIVYTCPLCPGWERRLDMRAGTMETKNKGLYFHISHFGQWSALPGEMFSVAIQPVEKTSLLQKISQNLNFN